MRILFLCLSNEGGVEIGMEPLFIMRKHSWKSCFRELLQKERACGEWLWLGSMDVKEGIGGPMK